MNSRFRRQHRFRAERIGVPDGPPASETSAFRQTVPVRPARFNVSDEYWGGKDGQCPSIPRKPLLAAPMERAYYIGLVEERDESEDAVPIKLFEWPGGRELGTVLSHAKHLGGRPIHEGTRIQLWTWVEYREGGLVERLHVELPT